MNKIEEFITLMLKGKILPHNYRTYDVVWNRMLGQ